MRRVRSGDAEIVYEVLGTGPPVVLLHPFPTNHEIWLPAVQTLLSRYRVILPDLRGHGDSELGDGPAIMAKHAVDVAKVMDDAELNRAPLVGVSIGGYVIFEFLRRYGGRVTALGLLNTKATADSTEARAGRLKAAAEVMETGTEPFFQGMKAKLLGQSTRDTRPDLVDGALRMMRKMSAEDVAMVQHGMAERPDSVATLKTVAVPALVVTGNEDGITGAEEAQLMQRCISGSEMKVIAKAGHLAIWEKPEEVGGILRQFLDSVRE